MVSQQLEVRPPSLSPARLVRKVDEGFDTFDKRLQVFIAGRDAGSVHGLRGSIRKLEASYSLVPKGGRPKPMKRYFRAVKHLRKATNVLRDYDVILAALSQVAGDREYAPMVRSLQYSRGRDLRSVLREATAVAIMRRPKLDEEDLRGAHVQKRVALMSKRLRGNVNRELAEFLKTHVAETMHDLRKDSRRLRYTLELSGADEGGDETRNRLREVQNSLGAVRDDDLVIEYLRKAKPQGRSRLFLREKTAERHAKIEEFVTKQRALGPLVFL